MKINHLATLMATYFMLKLVLKEIIETLFLKSTLPLTFIGAFRLGRFYAALPVLCSGSGSEISNFCLEPS
jgi:hypothetical protein